MLKNFIMEKKKRNNLALCTNCGYCIIKDNIISCDEGYFKNIHPNKVYILTPFDFDCISYYDILLNNRED